MSTLIKLKRTDNPLFTSSLGLLEFGELAINYNKGDIFFETTSSNGHTIEQIFTTTPNTGSLILTGSFNMKGNTEFRDIETDEIKIKINHKGYLTLNQITEELPVSIDSGSIIHSGSNLYVYI